MLQREWFCVLMCSLWLSFGCGPSSGNVPDRSARLPPQQAEPVELAVIEPGESITDLNSPFQLASVADDSRSQSGEIRLASADGEGNPEKKKDDELVVARVLLEYDKLPAGDICRGVVLLKVKEGWHINTNPARPDFLIPTTVSIKSKQKTELSDVKYPKGRQLTVQGFDEPLHVYEGNVRIDCRFTAPLIAAGQVDELEVLVKYQPCNDVRCLAPKTISLKGKLPVAGVGEVPKEINDHYFRDPEQKRE